MSDLKILITGGLGYLGGRIADSLKRNHPELTIILGTSRKISESPNWAKAFPIVRDLIVDRSAFDRIVQSGGFISVRTGSAPDGNAIPISKVDADSAMDAAACIGCGACVASCKNASAMLFTSAKAAHLNLLPQGQAEKDERAINMVKTMDEAGFGNCRNYGECSAACPKDISLDYIAKLNRDHAKAKLKKIFS